MLRFIGRLLALIFLTVVFAVSLDALSEIFFKLPGIETPPIMMVLPAFVGALLPIVFFMLRAWRIECVIGLIILASPLAFIGVKKSFMAYQSFVADYYIFQGKPEQAETMYGVLADEVMRKALPVDRLTKPQYDAHKQFAIAMLKFDNFRMLYDGRHKTPSHYVCFYAQNLRQNFESAYNLFLQADIKDYLQHIGKDLEMIDAVSQSNQCSKYGK